MALQTRTDAVQGEYVRLYCQFFRDGQLADPAAQPMVEIRSASYHTESSSSSEDLSTSSEESTLSSESSYEFTASGIGPFGALREGIGVWYVDWFVPDNQPVGNYYDIWTFQWSGDTRFTRMVLEFNVHLRKSLIDFSSPPMALKISDTMATLINDLSNDFIYEAQHIPVHWEQALKTGGDRTNLKLVFNNWLQNPKPLLRKNNNIVVSGWNPDYNGVVRLETPYDPEDQFSVDYQFAYFSAAELMGFINLGLYAMNTVPPASQAYTDVGSAPYIWRYGVILYAAMQAIRRILFGLCYQEKFIIYAEKPEGLSGVIGVLQNLYKDYEEQWNSQATNVKSKKLPMFSQIVIPEYTLPGGRSRWFRYMYKSGV